MTGRNPQGQPTPGAKIRAHGHGEGPLPAVLSIKLSAPPRGRHGGQSRAAGPVEARGTPGGHVGDTWLQSCPGPLCWWLHRHTGKWLGSSPSHTLTHTQSTPDTHQIPDPQRLNGRELTLTHTHTHTQSTPDTHQIPDPQRLNGRELTLTHSHTHTQHTPDTR